MLSAEKIIPNITVTLGRYWKQPDRKEIQIGETIATMSLKTFQALARYDGSIPTGVYCGKMWARCHGNEVLLCWFGPSEEPDTCSINTRKIVLIEDMPIPLEEPVILPLVPDIEEIKK